MTFFTGSFFIIILLTAQNHFPVMNANLWESAGVGPANDRNQPAEATLTPANVHSLTPLWTFTTGGDVLATPTVDATAVYVPEWAGNLFAVSRSTGQVIWSHKVSEYDGFSGAFARVSPAISGNDLIIGDIESTAVGHEGAEFIGQCGWIWPEKRHLLGAESRHGRHRMDFGCGSRGALLGESNGERRATGRESTRQFRTPARFLTH